MADEIENSQLLPTPIKTIISALRNNSKAIILNSHIMATYYDLLENDSFYVKFDIPTPRPHFIILPKHQACIKPDFSQMTPEQRKKLMKAARSMMKSFDIPSGILSIHRGYWFSSKIGFHAHLCVEKELYLKVFDEEKCNIVGWPNAKFLTKEWKANQHPELYHDNVRGYPYENTYFERELAAIRELKLHETVNLRRSVQQLMNLVGELKIPRLLLHPSEPKIGFVGKKDEIHSENLVWAMERFAAFLGLTNPDATNENDGCHLCLHFGLGKFIYTAC